jgi:hypothetical protein
MTEHRTEALTDLRDAIERFAAAAPSLKPAPHRVAAPSQRDALRWVALDREFEGQIAGKRVLVVDESTGYDAAMFAERDAAGVVCCDRPGKPDPLGDATFDIVHCADLLHRVCEPIALLATLRRMVADDGTLLIGSMMIADPERSEYLRFIPDRIDGDPSWWFVPGRLAFRWLVQTAGFEVESEFGEYESPLDGLPIVFGYLRGTPQ